jgi:hypothetical protein
MCSPPPSPDEEDEDYHVVKEKADEAMEDAAPPCDGDVPPGVGDLPLDYQAVMAGGYDEEAMLQQVLEASKADEDKVYLVYSDAIALPGMVAEHLASLPPPPPLPRHAPLLEAYEGQKVLPPGIPRRRRDHPHGVVINPPPQLQPEVIVDLVSDDDE